MNMGNNTSLLSECTIDGFDKGGEATVEKEASQKEKMMPHETLGKNPRTVVNLTDDDEASGSKKICTTNTAIVFDKSACAAKPVVPKTWTQPLMESQSMDASRSNLVVCNTEYRRTPCLEVGFFSVLWFGYIYRMSVECKYCFYDFVVGRGRK